jgi:stage V sporulation protein SpoVS
MLEAAVTVRRACLLANSRCRPPSNGIDFATSPAHTALELEQQDCMLEAAVTVRRACLLVNSRCRPPSNGVDFAASPAHAALELEQQDRMLELGEGQGTSLE